MASWFKGVLGYYIARLLDAGGGGAFESITMLHNSGWDTDLDRYSSWEKYSEVLRLSLMGIFVWERKS